MASLGWRPGPTFEGATMTTRDDDFPLMILITFYLFCLTVALVCAPPPSAPQPAYHCCTWIPVVLLSPANAKPKSPPSCILTPLVFLYLYLSSIALYVRSTKYNAYTIPFPNLSMRRSITQPSRPSFTPAALPPGPQTSRQPSKPQGHARQFPEGRGERALRRRRRHRR